MIFMGNGVHSEDSCNDRHIQLQELFSELSGLQQVSGHLSEKECQEAWSAYEIHVNYFLLNLQKDLLGNHEARVPDHYDEETLGSLRKDFDQLNRSVQQVLRPPTTDEDAPF